jgi:hypothetical protein
MSEWRSIESAPKDGTDVLVFAPEVGVAVLARFAAPCDFMTEHEGRRYDISDEDWDAPDWFAADFIQGCRLTNDGKPTHWMPLPEPPSPSQE